ncbi:BPL-N domain-containing protein [Rhodococcus kronopolitis]|uniref:BPL-N domain-containing protein n=1 Tax=Rhodococcus kronopolitis TaxID=1460226 RepID=A0ABV9FVM3_9NOCA
MIDRRRLLLGAAGAGLLAGTAGLSPAVAQSSGALPPRLSVGEPPLPLALVYRGPASVPGCPESVATLLQTSPRPFRTAFVGPKEPLKITRAVLDTATVYAQPGGGSLSSAWSVMQPHANVIRNWVSGGGNYLGFCLGGYLAGATPGFNLLPGDTWQYITASNATVKTTAATRITVKWRGVERTLFFQDGPAFALNRNHTAQVLATYAGGQPAAVVADYAAGRVGVVGPHPEAHAGWFRADGVSPTNAIHPELGHDLIETTVYG